MRRGKKPVAGEKKSLSGRGGVARSPWENTQPTNKGRKTLWRGAGSKKTGCSQLGV